MQTPKPTPTPSAGSPRWNGAGSGWSPTGVASPTPAGTASPSPSPSASDWAFGAQSGTTTTTRGGKATPTYVYYDPTTGRLSHTAGPTPKPHKLPDNPLTYNSLDPSTKAFLNDIVDNTTRPSGRTWGTAADLWNYLQRQRRTSGGSVWDLMDEVASTSPRKQGPAAGSAAGSSSSGGKLRGGLSGADVSADPILAPDNVAGTDQPPAPTTNTAIYKTITSFTPADAESLLTSALTDAIGREPSAGEVRHFLGKLRSAARKNPSVSKVVSRNDGLGNTSQTTKQTPGFDSTSASMLAKHVSEGGAFEKERRQNTANEMFNSFLAAIQSPTQVR